MAMTFVFMASACGNSAMETESIDEVTDAKVKIGFSFDSFVLERMDKGQGYICINGSRTGSQC